MLRVKSSKLKREEGGEVKSSKLKRARGRRGGEG
jgi:hypothetical protein